MTVARKILAVKRILRRPRLLQTFADGLARHNFQLVKDEEDGVAARLIELDGSYADEVDVRNLTEEAEVPVLAFLGQPDGQLPEVHGWQWRTSRISQVEELTSGKRLSLERHRRKKQERHKDPLKHLMVLAPEQQDTRNWVGNHRLPESLQARPWTTAGFIKSLPWHMIKRVRIWEGLSRDSHERVWRWLHWRCPVSGVVLEPIGTQKVRPGYWDQLQRLEWQLTGPMVVERCPDRVRLQLDGIEGWPLQYVPREWLEWFVWDRELPGKDYTVWQWQTWQIPESKVKTFLRRAQAFAHLPELPEGMHVSVDLKVEDLGPCLKTPWLHWVRGPDPEQEGGRRLIRVRKQTRRYLDYPPGNELWNTVKAYLEATEFSSDDRATWVEHPVDEEDTEWRPFYPKGYWEEKQEVIRWDPDGPVYAEKFNYCGVSRPYKSEVTHWTDRRRKDYDPMPQDWQPGHNNRLASQGNKGKRVDPQCEDKGQVDRWTQHAERHPENWHPPREPQNRSQVWRRMLMHNDWLLRKARWWQKQNWWWEGIERPARILQMEEAQRQEDLDHLTLIKREWKGQPLPGWARNLASHLWYEPDAREKFEGLLLVAEKMIRGEVPQLEDQPGVEEEVEQGLQKLSEEEREFLQWYLWLEPQVVRAWKQRRRRKVVGVDAWRQRYPEPFWVDRQIGGEEERREEKIRRFLKGAGRVRV